MACLQKHESNKETELFVLKREFQHVKLNSHNFDVSLDILSENLQSPPICLYLALILKSKKNQFNNLLIVYASWVVLK